MCADFAIHDKGDGNPHAHIMLTMRPIEQNGEWGAKAINDYVLDKNGNRILQKVDKNNRKIYKRVKRDTTDWNTKEFLQRSRENWAAIVNRELEKKNLPQRVDHRSPKGAGQTAHTHRAYRRCRKEHGEARQGIRARRKEPGNHGGKPPAFGGCKVAQSGCPGNQCYSGRYAMEPFA